LASARALVAEGCRVTICARGEAKLREAAAELRATASSADRVIAVTADLATAEGVETVVRRTAEAFGGLDILVTHVGVPRGARIADTTDAEGQDALDQALLPAGSGAQLV